eukprot:RCo039858
MSARKNPKEEGECSGRGGGSLCLSSSALQLLKRKLLQGRVGYRSRGLGAGPTALPRDEFVGQLVEVHLKQRFAAVRNLVEGDELVPTPAIVGALKSVLRRGGVQDDTVGVQRKGEPDSEPQEGRDVVPSPQAQVRGEVAAIMLELNLEPKTRVEDVPADGAGLPGAQKPLEVHLHGVVHWGQEAGNREGRQIREVVLELQLHGLHRDRGELPVQRPSGENREVIRLPQQILPFLDLKVQLALHPLHLLRALPQHLQVVLRTVLHLTQHLLLAVLQVLHDCCKGLLDSVSAVGEGIRDVLLEGAEQNSLSVAQLLLLLELHHHPQDVGTSLLDHSRLTFQ